MDTIRRTILAACVVGALGGASSVRAQDLDRPCGGDCGWTIAASIAGLGAVLALDVVLLGASLEHAARGATLGRSWAILELVSGLAHLIAAGVQLGLAFRDPSTADVGAAVIGAASGALGLWFGAHGALALASERPPVHPRAHGVGWSVTW